MKTPLLATLLILTACSGTAETDELAQAPRAVDAAALATLDLKNAILVGPRLVSSGQPTPAQLAALPGVGIERVIQLRPADEGGSGWEEAAAAELGIEFVRIPVPGAPGLNEANARALDRALGEEEGTPTLLCCGSGNRVGGLLALRAFFVEGAPAEDALASGLAAGLTSAEPAVRAAMGLPAAE